MSEQIVYFIPGNGGRFINKHIRGMKIVIGDGITAEGYYRGQLKERDKCWIFAGKPYIPSEESIPLEVSYDPNQYRKGILQGTVKYFLVKHKKSGGYFVICRYKITNSPRCHGKYFADLLSFIDGRWTRINEWPFDADFLSANSKIDNYWHSYGNYYEEDFEVLRELVGP